jgi:hypothetical protein
MQKEQTSVVNIIYCRWKFIAGVNDTGKQFITGIIYTGEQSPVSTTLAIRFFPGVVDTGKK